MKTYEINTKIAKDLIESDINVDYLVWDDGTKITENELISLFNIQDDYDNLRYNLTHKDDDLYIDDVELIEWDYNLIEV